VAAVHQVAHRARQHVRARRKRFEPVDATQSARITEQFMTAAATGDMEGLLAMLAPDATWTTDSGGKAAGLRQPVVGPQNVARTVIGFFRAAKKQMLDVRFETVVCNSAPAVVVYLSDHLEAVFTVEIIDGKISNFYAINNPDKLVAVTASRQISRQ
jgi:RNA polymerase sigma-70 factor (ECF subfamily)